ncbi:hypothetical protein ROI_20990 [Roseburia intestinalis M50/1]|nr:hypothetical protein ROI_20990 [Roseburia intestinalis M50/1]
MTEGKAAQKNLGGQFQL